RAPLLRHRRQRLVEDVQALERLVIADVQRRVDPDDRRVAHRDEPAPQALLEERLREVLRDELLRSAVLNELDPQEKPLAPHIADERLPLLYRLQLLQHLASDAFGVL